VALIEALSDLGVGQIFPGSGLFGLLKTGKESRMMVSLSGFTRRSFCGEPQDAQGSDRNL